MFERLKYRMQLWELQRRRDKITKQVRRDVASSLSRKESSHVRGAIRDGAQMDIDEVDDDIVVLTTQFYVAQARRRFVEIPGDDCWTVSETFGSRHLTAVGISKLRSNLHGERKERWEVFQSHATLIISLVTASTGVLGAAIGVLAFLRSGTPKP
jgi:hypothetical protein